MNRPFLAALALAIAAGLAAPSGPAAAAEATAGAITVADAWARPTLPNRPSAAYAEIRNAGDAPDRLTGARSPAFGTIELHTTREKDGVMMMQRLEAIEAPAGGTVALAPGGLHIMLFEPDEALAEGTAFPLTLVFERAGEIEVTVSVERRGAGMDHGSMGHGGHGTGSD